MDNSTKKKKNSGRPPKGDDKLTTSINLKLTPKDYEMVQKKALKVGLSATQYAREMTLNGGVKSRFTTEELDLMRKLSGEANNLNQLAKRANQAGFSRVGNEIMVVLEWIKALLNDRCLPAHGMIGLPEPVTRCRRSDRSEVTKSGKK